MPRIDTLLEPSEQRPTVSSLLRYRGPPTQHLKSSDQADPEILYRMLQRPDPTQQEPGLSGPALDPTTDLVGFGFVRKIAQVLGAGAGKMLPLMAGATAYHGSPHLFDKFSLSKIGTGEGAQAYGHGLYFAENPKVAGSYTSFGNWPQRASGQAPTTLFKGEPVKFNQAGNAVGDYPPELGRFLSRVTSKGTYDLALDEAETTLSEMAKQGIFLNEQRILSAEIRAAKANKQHITGSGAVGNLYKVDIPDKHIKKMLDWDKPLSQQPESVRKALDQYVWNGKFLGRMENPKGSEIHDALVSQQGFQDISKWLNKKGIPGIKYLDQGSRQAGKGTRNFVLFDENIAKILERK